MISSLLQIGFLVINKKYMEICNLLLESGCIAIPIKSIGNLHKQLFFFWGINSANKMIVIYLQADKYSDDSLSVVWGSCSIFNFKVFSCLCTILLQMEQMHWLVLFILYTVVF